MEEIVNTDAHLGDTVEITPIKGNTFKFKVTGYGEDAEGKYIDGKDIEQLNSRHYLKNIKSIQSIPGPHKTENVIHWYNVKKGMRKGKKI